MRKSLLKRLLEGLYVLENQGTGDLQLGLKQSSLAAFEDFLFARFQMHSQIYSHRVDASFNTALTTLGKRDGCKLPPEIEKYVQIDDESFLNSSLLKASDDLRDVLLNREKWILVYKTTDKNDKIPDEIEKEVEKKVGEGLCRVNKSKR